MDTWNMASSMTCNGCPIIHTFAASALARASAASLSLASDSQMEESGSGNYVVRKSHLFS